VSDARAVDDSKRGLVTALEKSCPVMPRCSSKRAPSSRVGQQVLAEARQRGGRAPDQDAAQRGGWREEEVARLGGEHREQPPVEQQGRNGTAGDLDLGQLGHGGILARQPTGRAGRDRRGPCYLRPFPMRVDNSTPWPHLLFERRTAQDEPLLVIVVQAVLVLADEAFARPLGAQPPVHLADVYRGDPTCTSLRREGSLATFKPSADIHLAPSPTRPAGAPGSEWPVRIRVGKVDKSLRIVGPRFWEHHEGVWKLGPCEPTSEVPVSWERAFGGAHVIDGQRVAEERNPLGTGFLPDGVDTSAPIAAPQILAPDEPEHVPGERYVPQGIAPVSRDCSWRLDHAGTYDEAWRRERAPRFARRLRCAFL
jgi:hypothetical protein